MFYKDIVWALTQIIVFQEAWLLVPVFIHKCQILGVSGSFYWSYQLRIEMAFSGGYWEEKTNVIAWMCRFQVEDGIWICNFYVIW